MWTEGVRAGDLVQVRSAAEILRTLDAGGALDALPFMPEMLRHCGRRYVVERRAEKICDTINYTGSRRLRDTVLLADLRCEGEAHGGCQAECRLFWKTAWVRPVDGGTPTPPEDPIAREALAKLAAMHVTSGGGDAAGSSWRCQATELYRASEPLRVSDPRPYLRELASGNVSLGRFIRVTARAGVQELRRKLGLAATVPVRGTRPPGAADPAPLALSPGDWVQVKSRREIAATLTAEGKNRGLWFDREMVPFCGRTFRVRRRVSRFIDEPSGRMIELKSDCVTLEGVVCSGELSLGRWFCPRGIYPYWREAWLRRVATPAVASASRAATDDGSEAGEVGGS